MNENLNSNAVNVFQLDYYMYALGFQEIIDLLNRLRYINWKYVLQIFVRMALHIKPLTFWLCASSLAYPVSCSNHIESFKIKNEFV